MTDSVARNRLAEPAVRETTYGPFGEQYDVEPYQPPTIMGVDPLTLMGMRAGLGRSVSSAALRGGGRELGETIDAKRLMDVQAAKEVLGRTGSYEETMASMPKYLQEGFRQSLPWHERILERMGWGVGSPWKNPLFLGTVATVPPAAGLAAGWAVGKAAEALMPGAQKTPDGIPVLPGEPY